MTPDECSSDPDLLTDIEAQLCRFIHFLSPHQATVATLFVMHTHTFRAAKATPRLAWASAIPGCGKTNGSDATGMLCANSVSFGGTTLPALFRRLDQETAAGKDITTLAIDETDKIFGVLGDKDNPLSEFILDGYTPGRGIARALPTKEGGHTSHTFDTFAPMMLSGRGVLPDAVLSRTLVIVLERSMASDNLEELDLDDPDGSMAALRDRCAAWAAANLERLKASTPARPADLVPRTWQITKPLAAIAELFPDDLERCTKALQWVCTGSSPQSDETDLLKDIYEVWAGHPNAKHITPTELRDRLKDMPDSQWADYRNRGLTVKLMGMMLQNFHDFNGNRVMSKNTRVLDDGMWVKKRVYFPGQFARAYQRFGGAGDGWDGSDPPQGRLPEDDGGWPDLRSDPAPAADQTAEPASRPEDGAVVL